MATEEFTGEEWKQIGDLPYEVSSFGRVRRYRDARTSRAGRLILGAVQHGYRSVRLICGDYDMRRPVHQLVAEAFLGPRADGLQVNHIDGDKGNNRADNLEWVSAADNICHSYRLGLSGRGERHGRATITEATAVAIIEALRNGEKPALIRKRIGCSRGVVFQIKYGRTWRHLQNSTSDSSGGAITRHTAR